MSHYAGQHKDDTPTVAFSALPLEERNLALYDAFWAQLDQQYYEPALLATPRMRALRVEWREKAKALAHPNFAYGNISTRWCGSFRNRTSPPSPHSRWTTF